MLALNACRINSYSALALLESTLPNVEEIYLALNDFRDVPLYGQPVESGDPSDGPEINLEGSYNIQDRFFRIE